MFIFEDILLNFVNVKVFLVFDVREGFWYIKLDEYSSYLIIFWIFFG